MDEAQAQSAGLFAGVVAVIALIAATAAAVSGYFNMPVTNIPQAQSTSTTTVVTPEPYAGTTKVPRGGQAVAV